MSSSDPIRVKVASKRMRNYILLAAAIVAILGIVYSLASSKSHLTKAQQIEQIESTVKCPSCDGISALDSNTAGAFAVRSFVQKEVNAGESSSKIISQLEASYGPNILMTPPASYGGTIINLLPFVFVILVVGLIAYFGYRRRRKYPFGAETKFGLDEAVESDAVHADDQNRVLQDFPPGNQAEPLGDVRGGSELVSATVGADISEHLVKNSDAEEAQDFADPNKSPRRSFRKSWPLYIGALLIVGGIGSGIVIIRNQNSARAQALAEVTQAQNQAQEILQARVLANKGQDVQALQLLSSVLKVDPNQPIALAYQGWLLRQAGEKDKNVALINQGQQLLEKSVKLDPSYPDSRVFLGLILYQDRHDLSGAITQFKAFLADKPSSSFINATKSVIVEAYKQAGIQIPSQLSG